MRRSVLLFSFVAVVAATALGLDVLQYVTDRIAAGETCIKVPKGVYCLGRGGDTDGASFFALNRVKDIEVDFQGSELRGLSHRTLIYLGDCSGVTLKNAVLDYPDGLAFAQGVIEKVGPDGEWEIAVADGYSDSMNWGWPVQAYDGRTHDLVNPMRFLKGWDLKRIGPRRFRLGGGENRRGKVGDIAVWSVGPRGSHTVYLVNCAHCTLENVTAYSSPGGNGFREMRGAGGNRYIHCRLVPRPQADDPVKRGLPRLRSGNHDAFNSRSMKIGPTYDGCEARNHCDDDVNINGAYWFVLAVDGCRVRAVASDEYFGSFEDGPVQLMLPDGTVPVETPQVVSHAEASPPTDAERQILKNHGLVFQLANSINHAFDFTFAAADPRVMPGTVFVPQNAGGNNFAIRDCRFGPNRARGLILNASYGVVENCFFDRTESQAIRASSSYPWLEGGCCRDVSVKGCTFVDCNVYFGANLGDRRLLPPDSHRGISVVGNMFRGRSRLIVHGCHGLTIDGNSFECPEKQRIELRNVEK